MGIFDLFKRKTVEKVDAKKETKGKQPPDRRALLLKDCLEYEKEYLAQNKDTMYDFFGYLMDPNEIPFFVESTTKRHSGMFEFGQSVTPVTPKMLKHCVTHLEHDALQGEAKNVPNFVKKCYQIAHQFDVISKDEWDKTISELMSYIQKPHHFSEEQLRSIVSSLTVEQLEKLDWNEFSRNLKTHKVLPPSYLARPEVQVSIGKDGVPKTKLSYVSRTSPSTRELVIRRGDVVVFANGASEGQSDKTASKVWKDFCGKTFSAMQITENKQQIKQ